MIERFSKADSERLFDILEREFPGYDHYTLSLAYATGVLYAIHKHYEPLDTPEYTDKMNEACKTYLGSIIDSLTATVLGSASAEAAEIVCIPPEKLN